MDTIRRILDALRDLLWPRTCCVCRRGNQALCHECLSALPPHSQLQLPRCQHLDRLIVATQLNKTAESVVYALKYQGVRDVAPLMADLMSARYAKQKISRAFIRDNPTIVPVPLHATRLRDRGFNQAELMARRIAATMALRYDEQSLVRIRATGQQAKRAHRDERFSSMRDAFQVTADEGYLQGAYLLIDDVITTGATLNECARALKDAGARSVSALVFAHADRARTVERS